MIYDSLEIEGFRGFGSAQKVTFAKPNNNPGSGLTIIVGENNSGKSSVMEALRSFTTVSSTFSEGQRNERHGDRVKLVLRSSGGDLIIATHSNGGALTTFNAPSGVDIPLKFLVLPSRRHFDPYFGAGGESRDRYIHNIAAQYRRSAPLQALVSRLVAASERRAQFDDVLRKLIDPVPDWVIERSEFGQNYIKIRRSNGSAHSTEGAGEGLLSLMSIADALYDSNPEDVIAIDEPELSLHPAVLRRLSATLGEYSKDRQIILATHSPYFTDPTFLCNGGELCRVFQDGEGAVMAQLQRGTINRLKGLLNNKNNPHVLGLDAREIFFQNDKVILVEGQEDVIFYPDVQTQIGMNFKGSFFGWGVGGAENMEIFVNLLNDLGFSKVVGVLDSDKIAIAQGLQRDFPQYLFVTIPAADIRTKVAHPKRPEKHGLLDGTILRPELHDPVRELITNVNEYLEREVA